jgi:CPA2 family monovalent cation:H+ antiporter-2
LLAAQVLIVIATAVLLRHAFTKLHSKAQFALQETLSQPPAREQEHPIRSLPAILREEKLMTVQVPEHGIAGKFIGELGLRTRTGASVVGIQRDGASIINPGPDEELRAGDEVLLLGSQQHLESARQLLASTETN